VALLLPVLAFITGLLLAQTSISETVKPILSAWLARLLIPIVIIYNMVFYQSGSLSLMLFSFGSAFLIFFAYLALFKDRLLALCVSYTNMDGLVFLLLWLYLALKQLLQLWLYILECRFLAMLGL
jgi:hypothetical protein